MFFEKSLTPHTSDTGRFVTLQPARRLFKLALRVTAMAVLATAVASGSSIANAADPVPVSVTTTAAVDTVLTDLQAKTSDTDPRYLLNNIWYDGTPTCFRCTLGPSVLAAARGRDMSPNTQLVTTSVDTLDKAIADHQRADGSYSIAVGGAGNDIEAVLFANELAATYIILGNQLDSAHRTAWSSSLARSADFLIRNGNTAWYTNGNIMLATAINMDLTYRITGLSRFQTAAQSSLTFAKAPSQARWPGFGLQYTTTPTAADGSDGAAYFAESGGSTPGYDTVYTLFQSDMASMWYLLTGDAEAKRLTNLLFNQLWPRVRTSDWTIDVSGGSRKGNPGERYSFEVSALSILALKGGRTDLQGYVQSQVSSTLRNYKYATKIVSPGWSYNYGLVLPVIYAAVTGMTINTTSSTLRATQISRSCTKSTKSATKRARGTSCRVQHAPTGR